MPKPELGSKRTCPECSARFYDLTKSPAECPKCGHTFDPEVLLKPRRQRADAKTASKAKAAEAVAEEQEEELETEDQDTEETEGEDEGVQEVGDEVLPEDSLENEEDEDDVTTPRKSTGLEEDGLVEVEEDDDLVDDDNDDDVIEPLDDDEDMSGILDADLDGDKET